jgi:hypothetical protein
MRTLALSALVVAMAGACADSAACRSAGAIRLGQEAVDCYVAKAGRPPETWALVVAESDCGLRVAPTDARDRELRIASYMRTAVVTMGDGTVPPHWALCMVGRTVSASAVLLVLAILSAATAIGARRSSWWIACAVLLILSVAALVLGPIS